MKKILIIGFTTDSPDAEQLEWYRRLFKEALGEKAEVEACFYDEVCVAIEPSSFIITDEKNGTDLAAYDLVVFRGEITSSYMAYTISRYLAAKGIKYWNDYVPYRNIAKLGQLVDMQELGLPFPRTVFMQNKRLLVAYLKRCNWEWPLIVKAVNGSKGRDNYLVHNETALADIFEKNPEKNFLVQEYIPNESDYRLLVMGTEMIVVHRKAQAGSHLNNLSQGARIEVLPGDAVPATVKEQAIKLSKALKMPLVGVDVMFHKETGEHYFLEINSQPGWRSYADKTLPALTKLLSDSLAG